MKLQPFIFVLCSLLSCLNADPPDPNPNIEMTMRGIDISKKHPLPLKPEGDPSFRNPLFIFNDPVDCDGLLSFVHTARRIVCSADFESEAFDTLESYIYGSSKSSMSSWSISYEGPEVSGTVGVPIGPAEASITVSPPPNTASYGEEDSESSSSLEKFFSKEGGSISRSEARCSVFDVTIDIDDPSLRLHDGFIEAVKIIDLATTKSEKEAAMTSFIYKFGTHFQQKSVMGIGTEFETRFTNAETLNHDEQKRNECSSKSGGVKLFGFGADSSTSECRGSLSDTTQGQNTAVDRFTSRSYGTLPQGSSSLSDWSSMVHEMMVAGTLAPLPINQALEPMSKILLTQAVKSIIHNDGTPLNSRNVIDTAIRFYVKYCSLFDCDIPACPATVKLDGNLYQEIDLKKRQGRSVYKDYFNGNYLFYEGISLSWIVSPQFNAQEAIMQTTSCPQQGGIFIETTSDIPPIPRVSDWRECSLYCLKRTSCNFWQLKKVECSLFTNFESIEPASNDYLIGSKDCPGDEKVSQSSYGQCVNKIKTRSMWNSSNDDFFSKNHQVEAFDSTAVVLIGGYNGGNLKSAELLHGPKSCRIPDLPEAVYGHVLLLTSNGDNILSCGGSGNKNCYNLDIKGERWNKHSTLSTVRWYSTAVTMANGVYIFGGISSPTTYEILPKNNNGVWQAGPTTIPNGFQYGCGLKISEEEILLISGSGTENRIINFNTRTNSFSTRESTLQQGRRLHSCVLLNDLILVVGGRDANGNTLSSTEVIPLANGIPRYGGNLNTARRYFGLATIGGHYKKAISFGGEGSRYLNSVEEWDEDTEQWKLAPYSLEEGKRSFASLAVPPQMVCP